MILKKIGVVYTPYRLANFVAELLHLETVKDRFEINTILDPACGECALLSAASKILGKDVSYKGIDVDLDAILASGDEFKIVPFRARHPDLSYFSC